MRQRTANSPFRTLRAKKQGAATFLMAIAGVSVFYVCTTYDIHWLRIVAWLLLSLLLWNIVALLVQCFRGRAHWWALCGTLAVLLLSFGWMRHIAEERNDANLIAALPQLRELAETVRANPLEREIELNREIGPVTVMAGNHRSDATILVLSRNPDAEHGLLFTKADRPSPPGWVVSDSYTRIAPDCWRYSWYDQ